MHKNWKFLHACVVVEDMDKAIKHFEALGVEPFPPFWEDRKVCLLLIKQSGESHLIMIWTSGLPRVR